jgi:hypothetical protein
MNCVLRYQFTEKRIIKLISGNFIKYNYRNNMILDAIQAILSMKYYKNTPVNSGIVHGFPSHEIAIATKLIENGFDKWHDWDKIQDKSHFRNLTNMREWLTKPHLSEQMPVGTFIEQPFGTNDAPDFFIKVSDSFILPLEAKSCRGYTPMWNSGIPKPDYIYVFCSEKADATTIIKGSSIITSEQSRLIQEHIERHRQDDEELNEKLFNLDAKHRGITYYTRPMIQQHGTSDYTNYFKHKNRETDEKEVIEWIRKKSL